MRSRCPLIYLVLGKNEKNELNGCYTNGKLSDFHSFCGTSDMISEISALVEESTFFFELPDCSYDSFRELRMRTHRLFIIEILYRQDGEWQGYIHGILKSPHTTFRSRRELILRLEAEINSDQIFEVPGSP